MLILKTAASLVWKVQQHRDYEVIIDKILDVYTEHYNGQSEV